MCAPFNPVILREKMSRVSPICLSSFRKLICVRSLLLLRPFAVLVFLLHFPFLIRATSFFLLFFRAALAAYGSSQARGRIRATAAGLYHSHSNAGSEPHLRPTPQPTAALDPSLVCSLNHSSQQCPILNPLSEARDQTPSCLLIPEPQEELQLMQF